MLNEPRKCNKLIYENEHFLLERKWDWNVKSIYKDHETGLLHVLIEGQAFNWGGTSTYATLDGTRLSKEDFVYSDSFQNGFATIQKRNGYYGFVDITGEISIPAIYEKVDHFYDGKAVVQRENKGYLVDKNGIETELDSDLAENDYCGFKGFSEGMGLVSVMDIDNWDLAYHSDYDPGLYGFVDINGKVVIKPQFIYANHYSDGVAIVCKGQWMKDKKWDNKYRTDSYWTEVELWGGIDKEGNEVIPFIFDEIGGFWDTEGIYKAHYGGWENGHWGVIDNKGNWLTEPMFERIEHNYYDGLIVFSTADEWEDECLLGIYDIKNHRVLHDPRFLDVTFEDNGDIVVYYYDEELGEEVSKVIDREGNEIFPSHYSRLYFKDDFYEASLLDKYGGKNGLIDRRGNVVVPCEYDIPFNGILVKEEIFVNKVNEKFGLCDFDGKTIIEPKYDYLAGWYYNEITPLLIFGEKEKDTMKYGLLTWEGDQIVPAVYRHLEWCKNEWILCHLSEKCEMLKYTKKN